jgi:serine/threonine protein kinase
MSPAADDEILVHAKTRIGTLLRGKYRLDCVLGVGGMAVVYAATHRNKKRFAVKVLHPELSFRRDLRARFLREGYAANSVEHPGTVAVLDDDVAEDGAAFLVMELLDGETVEERWERSGQRLPLEAVLSIGYELLDVLAAAHARGIVHRDIKPANLFLTRDEGLKVLDFGIARLRDIAASQATQMGAMMGTPSFMSPEQALGATDEVDAQTDVWATGATLFTLASGRMVHEAGAMQGVIVKAATQPAPSLAAVLPGAPSTIVQAIDRALAFDKAQRWPSAGAMRDALREASLACFGRIPSLPPVAAPSALPPMATLPSDPGLPSIPVHVPTVYSVAPGRPLTTAPVSSDPVPTLPGLRRHRLLGVLLAAVAGVATLAALVAVTLFATSHHAASKAATSAPPPDSAPALDTPPSPATLPAVTLTPPPDISLTPPPALSPSLTPKPALSLTPTLTPAAATAARPKPSSASADARKPDCNPNFYLDAQGEKHFKPECFLTH